ncbi:methylated-DNA-[protein]-cysteine S-methyltransferase [Paenibacillus sp. UNC496MF]|uniref:methylated-DNA--[protein]-cysteine S-methyltransferase n=1 Tax=Paenibacillus sp. UNC496MF TaxID=1502753 RepID=UPI0008E1DAED|nr:methylated-DNA--[protein]-cysteine S-methyltransferase [Paenibacillus sp. UNC496MF]SFI33600.1 methylated-DNA-[protein]-cysteine S-methyltransferase [Paenibacillus sp. UNC496MF]
MSKFDGKLYWSLLDSGDWRMHIAATDKGLCYIGTPGAAYADLAGWAARQLPGTEPRRDDAAMAPYAAAIRAYLEDGARDADVAMDLRGTAFQQAVWQELRLIPSGEVRAYSDVAERLGRPSAVRAVAGAIGANPVLLFVPCHRVLGKNGTLTGFRAGMAMKAELLRREGALRATS